MANSDRSATETLLIFVSGAVAGAALTILVSPEIRRKASERLQQALATIKEESSAFLEKERESLSEGAGRIKSEVKTLREAYHAGWDAFQKALKTDGEGEENTPPSP